VLNITVFVALLCGVMETCPVITGAGEVSFSTPVIHVSASELVDSSELNAHF